MAQIEWELKGPQLATCNCNWGCPCQFNSLPSEGHCRAAVAMRIDSGSFDGTKLDGLKWVGLFAWPGPIHLGNGAALAVVDERANDAQREAILKILTGQESDPGATYFNVFASTLSTFHDPIFSAIDFEADISARRGRFSVPKLVEASVSPIVNAVTGAEHRVRVALPHGFEFSEAEFASSTVTSSGPIANDWSSRHCHLATIHINRRGPIR